MEKELVKIILKSLKPSHEQLHPTRIKHTPLYGLHTYDTSDPTVLHRLELDVAGVEEAGGAALRGEELFWKN